MTDKPSYYSILTADVRYDEKLNASEKLLFSEITALSNRHGYCTAGNGYFSKLYNVSDRSVTRWIKHLKELGYLKYVPIYKKDSKEVDERRLYPLTNSKDPLDKNVYGGRQKCPRPLDKNVEDNITSINNINMLDKDNSEVSNTNRFNYSKFINSINEEANTNFRNSSNNRKLIHARLADGYTEEELIKVIKFKANQWKDNEKMKKYIVLTTLLRPSNFDKYIQEVESIPEPQEKRKRKVPLKEKERDPIEEKIYQYKLFLQEHPENEDVREELRRLERNRTENSGDVA
ncbi:conserved phage C-terminal domain-containing protein [Ligilactobacillus salivarius]|uniref:Conserved phage C-terminal domain-containing protein n=1 Tax=Ligilactobacillus salivarius TaxID=1624 RepID=A0ABD7YT34_9LACO|nr:conserved phage C-terminal domain-containing protein [Ligilactobacillus salivarius]WHS06279.1 conserved phage C-terminal domain-containing protein [Ligilactobacillus salivarius]WHS07638.1 conserved phage C-terminal domain-containing protein [Ligilactobacillus salivarius]WHS10198.1 conserved phage C-terminal domain-containing protein [Ligilactobacillus salivarius]WHS14135.1 conserved phage C-terminal domain-containing protein [Ligilactobacillus salivarius]WHS17249.1 conserved phage C-termina